MKTDEHHCIVSKRLDIASYEQKIIAQIYSIKLLSRNVIFNHSNKSSMALGIPTLAVNGIVYHVKMPILFLLLKLVKALNLNN